MVDRRLRLVRNHVGWMVASILVLVALNAFSLVLFYVVSLIGFFVVYELTKSVAVRPRWERRLRFVAVVWIVVFGVIAAWQIAEIVTSVV